MLSWAKLNIIGDKLRGTVVPVEFGKEIHFDAAQVHCISAYASPGTNYTHPPLPVECAVILVRGCCNIHLHSACCESITMVLDSPNRALLLDRQVGFVLSDLSEDVVFFIVIATANISN